MLFSSFSKEARFKDLVDSVQCCSLCPRLRSRRRVLSPANGSIESKVVFVAEAPGRLGAERTGVPLYGDKTGDNFESLLGNIGWKRDSVFVTNAILCNPRDKNGNNGTPTTQEITNCSTYLQMVIELIQPDVVVSLGTTALKSLELIAPHGLTFAQSVAKPIPWNGRILFPLYHPGPRALVHRSLAKQRSDFMKLAKLVNPVKGFLSIPAKRKKPEEELIPDRATYFQQTILAFLQCLGKMTRFKLTKLLYFADLFSLEKLSRTITGEIYLRQVDGPWPPQLKKTLEMMNGYEVRTFFLRGMPMITPGPSPRFSVELPDDAVEVIMDVAEKYGNLGNSAIKTAVYRSSPMRYILKEEKKGRTLRNVPLLYNEATIIERDESD